MSQRKILLIFVASAFVAACAERAPAPTADVAPAESQRLCHAPDVRQVVGRLGARMKRVSLQAPRDVVVRAIREAYAGLVTGHLLERWVAQPERAPGRRVSSPWPERLEIRSVEAVAPGVCRVVGEVIYITSVERVHGGAALRKPISLWVRKDGEWRISAYRAALPAASVSASAAAGVLRRYYAAIAAGDFRRAYELWAGAGAASGQTFKEFAAGFVDTARVRAELGEPGRIEPAAGSRYVTVPAAMRAVTASGQVQRFEGRYTLRRSVVTGALWEQRHWHIYSAEITRVR